MAKSPITSLVALIFLCLLMAKTTTAQTLAGTTWNITVPSISAKPYNFIFGASDNKGNVLMPNGTLSDFTWSEDGKGNWSIQIIPVPPDNKKTEIFYGKITGNSGTGFYSNTKDRKNLKPLTMVKK